MCYPAMIVIYRDIPFGIDISRLIRNNALSLSLNAYLGSLRQDSTRYPINAPFYYLLVLLLHDTRSLSLAQDSTCLRLIRRGLYFRSRCFSTYIRVYTCATSKVIT